MTSTKLQKQLDGLRARHTELTAERDKSASELEKTRKSIISGKASVDDATMLQTKLNTANSVLTDIDAQIENLQTELEAVEQLERREAAFNEIEKLAVQSLELSQAFEEKLLEFDTFAHKFGNELLQLKAQIYQARTAFHQHFEILLPDARKLSLMYQHYPEIESARDAIFEELAKRKINLSVLRSERIFASLHFLDDMSGEAYRPPQTAFSGIVWKLLDIAANAQPEPQNDEAGEVEPGNVEDEGASV